MRNNQRTFLVNYAAPRWTLAIPPWSSPYRFWLETRDGKPQNRVIPSRDRHQIRPHKELQNLILRLKTFNKMNLKFTIVIQRSIILNWKWFWISLPHNNFVCRLWIDTVLFLQRRCRAVCRICVVIGRYKRILIQTRLCYCPCITAMVKKSFFY